MLPCLAHYLSWTSKLLISSTALSLPVVVTSRRQPLIRDLQNDVIPDPFDAYFEVFFEVMGRPKRRAKRDTSMIASEAEARVQKFSFEHTIEIFLPPPAGFWFVLQSLPDIFKIPSNLSQASSEVVRFACRFRPFVRHTERWRLSERFCLQASETRTFDF